MRRFLLSLLACVMLLSACGETVQPDIEVQEDPGETTTSLAPPTTTEPTTTTGSSLPALTTTTVDLAELEWPGERFPDDPVPPLLIADGSEILLFELLEDGVLLFDRVMDADHPVTDVYQASDGTIFTREWVEISESESAIELARYAADGTRTLLDDIIELYGVGVIDAVDVVIGAVESPDGFGFGGVRAFAVDDLRQVADFGLRAEAEFGVTYVGWSDAAGIAAVSAWSDLTEWIGFVDAAGEAVELPSPTDDIPYNSPPYVTAATISLDGRTLYWAEGPDWGFDESTGDSGPIAAQWILRGADLETGEEVLYWPLSDEVLDLTVLNVHSIEDLGDQILINRTELRGARSVALAPLILDFTTEEPGLYDFPAFGVATRAATADSGPG